MEGDAIIELRTVSGPSNDTQHLTVRPSAQQLYANLAVPAVSHWIRVLDIHPVSKKQPNSPLTGDLRVVSLRDQPAFTTLSYVWGPKLSPSPKLTVLSHHVDLDITESCLQALCSIRKQFGALTIWVDSICINQDDEEEKATQIQLMSDIYSSADVGYIWLGGDGDSDFAVDFLTSRATYFTRLSLAYLRASSVYQKRLEMKRYKKKVWEDAIRRLKTVCLRRMRPYQWHLYTPETPSIPYRELVAKFPRTEEEDFFRIQNLLQHDWSCRIWTFQELVLSRNPVLVCGDKVLLWEDFVNAICVPDENPTMAAAIRQWRLIVDMWLNFPRQPCRPRRQFQVDSEASENLHSFKELINTFRINNGVPTRPLYIALWTLEAALPLMPTTGIIYMLCNEGWYDWYVIIVIALAFLHCRWVLNLVTHHRFRSYICFGMKPNWAPLPEASGKSHGILTNVPDEVLNGVWSAPRKRASTEACDKAFGLFGILTASGASPRLPLYSQNIKEIYWGYFQCLLLWRPTAVTLILDAGIQNLQEPGWPSWLPNWSLPEYHAWLLDQVRAMSWSNTQSRQPPEPATISGNTMSLRGRCIGFVASRRIAHDTGGAQLFSSLLELKQWIRAAQAGSSNFQSYRDIQGSLFAILEGLSPTIKDEVLGTRTTMVFRRGIFKNEAIRLPISPWSYDFTSCGGAEGQFSAFKSLYHIIDSHPKNTAEAMLADIRGVSTAFDYLIRIINKLAEEQRCLFVMSSGLAGSASLELVTGDEVFLLSGVRAPVILRAHHEPGTHTLVGPILVHGLMHGEEFNEEDLTSEITLK